MSETLEFNQEWWDERRFVRVYVYSVYQQATKLVLLELMLK